MSNPTFLASAEAIARNRESGASELLAQLLPLLGDAIAAGRETVTAVARLVCAGQPAMAPLWNACAAAVTEFQVPGRFARRRAEMDRAPRALAKAATAALMDALAGEDQPQLLTLSYSSSVATALCAIVRERPLAVICGESQPGGEGARMRDQLASAGAGALLIADALLTTYLPTATAVLVGADAISAADWTNKCGTFGLAAAASFTGTPVYVVASRDKAQSAALRSRMQPSREFERTPLTLATAFLTDAGIVAPPDVPALAERYAEEVAALVALL